MTTNQTINIPRDLADKLARCEPGGIWPSGNPIDELRALLDAADCKPFTTADGEHSSRFRVEGSTVHIDGMTRVHPAPKMLTGLPLPPGECTIYNDGEPPYTFRVGEEPARPNDDLEGRVHDAGMACIAAGVGPDFRVIRAVLAAQARSETPAVVLPERFSKVMQYLLGSGELDGYYFRDTYFSGLRYWWRNELRASLDELTRLNTKSR